ncbi:MAG: lipoate--protein ligase family protein, partial [Candidatus Methylomirabilales bacterium]
MGEVAGTPTWFQSSRWRLLVDEPRDGPTNMAVDEALALGCDGGWSPPTLRAYRWALPTVSLGVNQSIEGEVNLTACRERRIPVVRRPTGGRALLHDRELTYSLAIPILRGSRSVLHDYRWISHCLLLALRRVGVAAT